MNLILAIIIFLLFAYTIIIFYFSYYYLRLSYFHSVVKPSTRFSIIIPARNEANNISGCLASILANAYDRDLYEIIVIDDFSVDDTAAIVSQFSARYSNVTLIKMQDLLPSSVVLNSYKKKAITMAIARAKYEYILCTDADCTVGPYWLLSFAQKIVSQNAVFTAGPVAFVNNNSLLSIFQTLDFMSLQGITAASVAAGKLSMCNGANICYSKAAFDHVHGFEGVDQIASGDDMFLMYKMMRAFPGRIAYLFTPNAIVKTLPMPTVKSFINQRIRWASKANKYEDKRITFVLAIVYLLNLMLAVSLIYGCLFNFHTFLWTLALILIKTLVEMLIMVPTASFFSARKLLYYFPLMQIPHIFYTVVAGMFGVFGKYQWKGRSVK